MLLVKFARLRLCYIPATSGHERRPELLLAEYGWIVEIQEVRLAGQFQFRESERQSAAPQQ